MKVSELKTEMDGKSLRSTEEFKELRQLIKTEGEATRRHVDIVAEKIVSERNLALDRSMATAHQLVALTASNAGDHVTLERRPDDHDRRLQNLEKARDADPDSR